MYVLCLAALAVMIAPVFQQMYTIPETTEAEERPNNEHFFSQRDNNSQTTTDAWLTLELLSWQGNSSTTWDTDGTDIDPQFQVCIDLDGDLDGISPRCEWTQIWNNTLALSNAWNTTFDLVEENHLLNISIECWDNDDDTDEWNNGPDACDMNPADDEWRLYYEVNWSNITTQTFSGDGSLGNDTQWGNAESTWKVTITYYGDEDNDMISDNIDFCRETSHGDEVDELGCSVFQYDWDGDGLSNSVDSCPTIDSEFCYAIGDYIKTHTFPFSTSGFNPPMSHVFSAQSWDISPDGRYAVSLVETASGGNILYAMLTTDLESGQTNYFGRQSMPDIEKQRLKFSPDGKFLVRHQTDYAYFYTVEEYTTEGFFENTNRISIKNYCLETTGHLPSSHTTGLTFTKNSEYVKFKVRCGNNVAEEEILVNVSNLEFVSDVEVSSEESGGFFNGYETFWTESKQIDINGTMVRQVTDPEHGFTVIRNGESLMVPTEKEVIQFSSTDDGNFLFVMSADRTHTTYADTHNETLEIYDLRTGQSLELDSPTETYNWDYPPERSMLNSGKISSNGLRIVVDYDGAWHVYERDQDRDSFVDSDDLCFDTTNNLEVNDRGCALYQLDNDEDGIPDAVDECPFTPTGDEIGVTGCSLIDDDNDTINDDEDQCLDTASNLQVDDNGCALYQLDSDGDGVSDASDECLNTPENDAVKVNGCSFVDGDSDTIDDDEDKCPNTPIGETVGLTGCSSSQLDADSDGIYDLSDYCPYTAANSTVDVNGCATDDIIDFDSDSDGIRDSIDQCDSSSGVVVDDSGCQISVSSSTEELDDGLNDGIWLASCCFGLLFALLICYFGWHYYDTKQFSWAIILNLVILFIIIFSWSSLLKLSYNEEHAFQCPDGTIVTYGDSRDARGESNMESLEEFLANPPPEWCEESIVWLDELTDQYAYSHLAIVAGIFTIPNAILVYFQKSTGPFGVSLLNHKKSSSLSTSWYKREEFWKGLMILSAIASVIIFALLPIGPIESDVDDIPGSSFLMNWACDEDENITECRTDDSGYVNTPAEEYRLSLIVHFIMALMCFIVAAILVGIDEDNWLTILFGGCSAIVGFFMALFWLYGTLALTIHQIIVGNIFYLINLIVLVVSITGLSTNTFSFLWDKKEDSAMRSMFTEYFENLDAEPHKTKPKQVKGNTSRHGKGKIDHEQIKRLVRQYSDNKVVLQNYIHNSLPEPKESSLMNAIRHRRSEYEKELQSKPKSLREQGSVTYLDKDPIPDDDDEWDDDDEIDIGSYIGLVLEDEEVFGTIIEFDDDEGLVTIEEDGTGDLVTGYQDDMFLEDYFTDNKLNKQGRNNTQSAQIKTKIKPVDTDFLNSSKGEKQPIPSKPIITEDSQGVITRTTSFSVVRIDKISQIVEKTPTRDDLNQMFIDEITTMKALDDKNIEVGLIDYELGNAPKIVTRYFGSHKLGDVIATANDRGKKILISELIRKVNKIHGAGWVHRDLKPDNIMVDKRPKGDHRFAEIIDYGIAMKINRRQKELHNTAGTVFFGHRSQKDTNFNASTGQDWFAMARIIALIIRATDIETLDAEINMSMNGLNLEKELAAVGFNDDQVNILQSMISLATQHNCQENDIINKLSNLGKQLNNKFQ